MLVHRAAILCNPYRVIDSEFDMDSYRSVFDVGSASIYSSTQLRKCSDLFGDPIS
jgi:hypothetical protein